MVAAFNGSPCSVLLQSSSAQYHVSMGQTSEVLGSVNQSAPEKQVKCAVLNIYGDVGYLPFDVFEDPVGLARRYGESVGSKKVAFVSC